MGNKEVLRFGTYVLVLATLAFCHPTEAARVETIHADVDINEVLEDFHGSISSLRRVRRSAPDDGDATCRSQERDILSKIGGRNISDQHIFQNVSMSHYHHLSLIWTGQNDGVILVIAWANYYSSYSPTHIALTFRSEDGGRTFANITHSVPVKITSTYGIQNHPYNSNWVYIVGTPLVDLDTVIVTGAVPQVLYRSTDGGLTFKKFALEFDVDNFFIFHTSEDYKDYFMTLNDAGELYVTWNNGEKWRKTGTEISRARWGYDPRSEDKKNTTSKTIYMTKETGKRPYHSEYSYFYQNPEIEFHDLLKSDDGETFRIILSQVIGFGELNGYLYASVFEDENDTSNANRLLKISTQNGERGTWQDAQVPSITPDQYYSVVEMDENLIFLHVDEPGYKNYGTLYTSEVNSVIFTESLLRHLGSETGKTDFYKVQSMRGVYITTQVLSNGGMRSVITYNRGATWQSIPAPPGVPCDNDGTVCTLQLYLSYTDDHTGTMGELPLSEPMAIGLILAHGHVADSFKQHSPDLFVSSDGGYSWNLALEGPHMYVIADSGGLIAAVPYNRSYSGGPSQIIRFSTDEGRCWHEYNFTSTDFIVRGLYGEPGAKTLNISIWGTERPSYHSLSQWQTFIIDFKTPIQRPCSKNDYETWMAHSSHRASESADVQGCLLGKKETFERLKKDSCCYNGYEYEVNTTSKICTCTREDYDCDYGYERLGDSDECIEVFTVKKIHICLRGHEEDIISEGYIKIPGDVCQGGFKANSKLVNVSQLCEDYSKDLVIEDLTPANVTSQPSKLPAGTTKSHKIAIIAVVAVVLVVALVVSAFLVRKLCLSKKKKEQRYTLLNHTDEEEYDDSDDVSQSQPGSRLTIRTEVEPERPRNKDDAVVNTAEGGVSRQAQPNRTGYHDDSDDDMLMT